MLERIGWLAVVAAAVADPLFTGSAGSCPEDRELAAEAAAVLRADYRGDRAELARLARELAAKPPRRNEPYRAPEAYRAYWAGFASWRRGMNGYNETPTPADLLADFENCAERERTALALDASLDDARGALAGCLMGQAVSTKDGPERRATLLREARDLLRAVEARAEGNPRSLWMVGGWLMWAPPEQGGDRDRAEATFLRGLEAARREALGPRCEPWIPSWGAPENLMSLAFLHTLGPEPDPAVARAYAEGALAMAPDWRFVRHVLLPRIAKLSGERDRPEGRASRAKASP